MKSVHIEINSLKLWLLIYQTYKDRRNVYMPNTFRRRVFFAGLMNVFLPPTFREI